MDMPTVLDSLNAIAKSFSVSVLPPETPPPPKGTVKVELKPPTTREEALTVPLEPTRAVEIKDATFNLDWIAKDVRFSARDLADKSTIGGMPIADPIPIPTGSTLESLLKPYTEGKFTDAQNQPTPGVPGVLGQLTGTVGVPLEVTKMLTANVSVEVEWRVRDEAGNLVSEFTMTPAAPTPEDVVTFAFKSFVTELTNQPEPVVKRFIEAAIRLRAGTTSTDQIVLPSVPVVIPVLRVPTILVMFQDKNFDNSRMVLVPGNSPLAGEGVDDALNALATALNTLPLPSIVDRAALLEDFGEGLTRLSFFAALMPDPTNGVAFRKADGIANLNDVVIWDTGLFFLNNTEAEDEMTSLVLIGPPGRKVETYIAREFSDSEGAMNVTVGKELFADIGDLKSKAPQSTPADRVEVTKTPGRAGVWPVEWEVDFSESISSVRFGWS